jgi:glycosyltransferase involved in cell wall biosynthesis
MMDGGPARRPPLRVLYAITHHTSAQNFLRGQLSYMKSQGAEVHLVCGPGPGLLRIQDTDGPTIHVAPTAREIAPLNDLITLGNYIRLIRRTKPHVVNGSTPKAALLVHLAAKVLGVKRRVYVIRGLRSENERGPKRRLLEAMERVTCWAATEVLAVSPSLRDEYLARNLNARRPVTVVGSGSSNGVDTRRFSMNFDLRANSRARLGLSPTTTVVTFIGRINADKGIPTLVEAIKELPQLSNGNARFLVQGDLEDDRCRVLLEQAKDQITHIPWGDTKETLAATDILVLPTLREGFPNVILEAASMGIPSITTTATGARDAVIDQVTGILVPPGRPEALRHAIITLLESPSRRLQLGRNAHLRVVDEFAQEEIWSSLYSLYMGVPTSKA